MGFSRSSMPHTHVQNRRSPPKEGKTRLVQSPRPLLERNSLFARRSDEKMCVRPFLPVGGRQNRQNRQAAALWTPPCRYEDHGRANYGGGVPEPACGALHSSSSLANTPSRERAASYLDT